MAISVNDIKVAMSSAADEVVDQLKDHLEAQPYQITCYACGGDLEFEKTIDSDNDLILKVHPCDCVKED